MTRHLVLLGGGHANLHVLEALATRRFPDVRVTLVSPHRLQFYSGMLPGWISGQYLLEECVIALDRLAKAAGAKLLCTSARAVDPGSRRVRLANGDELDYDLLAIDVGSDIRNEHLRCASGRLTPVRPLHDFVERYRVFSRHGKTQPMVVIGGGMGGIEIACALRVASGYRAEITLLAGCEGVVPTRNEGLKKRLRHEMKACGVTVLDEDALRVDDIGIETSGGRRLAALFVVLATGPQPSALLKNSGLPLDAAGYLLVDASLRSTGHPAVFAAGDCASLPFNGIARSGVYAVRQGPVLAHNLRATLTGGPLQPFRPQRRVLSLIATGPHHAVAAWGRWSCSGKWLWWWKRDIDRKFVRRFSS
jgi:pyridine nucleotide-disulfide oxidoreductase family protein